MYAVTCSGWSVEWNLPDAVRIIAVDERPGRVYCSSDSSQIVQVTAYSLGGGEVGPGHAEAPGAATSNGVLLGLVASDGVVLMKGDPAEPSCFRYPSLIVEALGLLLAVVLGHGCEPKTLGSQKPRNLNAAKAPVDKDVRQIPNG